MKKRWVFRINHKIQHCGLQLPKLVNILYETIKLSGKMSVGRLRRRWVDNVKCDARYLELEGNWTERVIYRIGRSEIIVAALSLRARCGQ